jgi:hypothetical protein
MRGILALGLAVALASSVPMQQAEASKAGDVAAGIAIGAGIAALAAASASSAQRYYNMPDYDYNHGISGEGNAIAACTHKAWRRASRDGARQLSLVKVKDTRWKATNGVSSCGSRPATAGATARAMTSCAASSTTGSLTLNWPDRQALFCYCDPVTRVGCGAQRE